MDAERLLIALYESSNRAVRRRGRTWYPKVRRRLQEMADEYGYTLSQVAAVCAITSVDAQLSSNLRWTEEILRGEREAGRYPASQAPLVARALTSSRPGRHVRGPKCRAFYRAIMGDNESVVLDRWAARAAGYREERGKRRDIPVRQRRAIEAAYRAAAAAVGERVCKFQAIVWIVVRETTPTSDGRVPQLACITRGAGCPRKPRVDSRDSENRKEES